MKKCFRRFVFVVVVALMLISIGQPRGSAALDKPPFDPACLSLCQQHNLECFFGVSKPSDEKKCTAEYRNCIAHCK